MQRTTRQTCIPPGLLVNVFRAGVPRWKSKLHWPQARTAATVAGPSLYGIPENIMYPIPLLCLSAGEPGEKNCPRYVPHSTTVFPYLSVEYLAYKLPVVSDSL